MKQNKYIFSLLFVSVMSTFAFQVSQTPNKRPSGIRTPKAGCDNFRTDFDRWCQHEHRKTVKQRQLEPFKNDPQLRYFALKMAFETGTTENLEVLQCTPEELQMLKDLQLKAMEALKKKASKPAMAVPDQPKKLSKAIQRYQSGGLWVTDEEILKMMEDLTQEAKPALVAPLPIDYSPKSDDN